MHKAKPHYGEGDHALYADIIGHTTPFQFLTRTLQYEQVFAAYVHAVENVDDTATQAHNEAQFKGFLDRAEIKLKLSARVADMFAPRGGLVH